MKLPSESTALLHFARETIEECLVSREPRRIQASAYRNLFYTGSLTTTPSKNNRCYSHVDKLASYLFSPSEVRFTVGVEDAGNPDWQNKFERTGRYLNSRFNRRKCGLAFAQANMLALVEGSCFIKLNWGPAGYEPWVIPQSFMGVLREDIDDFDRQEAFTHSFYVTKSVFRNMVKGHPDEKEIVAMASATAQGRDINDLSGDSYFHQMVLGGLAPVQVQGQQGPSGRGAVAINATTGPMLAPEVARELIRVDDLWVWDDDRSDYTTIRVVEPGLLVEGRYKRRNLSDAPKRHNFIKVCSNEVTNYFWGRSELATVLEAQMLLNARVDDIDTIFRLRAKPPRSFAGFQGLTDEKARALLSPGGVVTEGATGATVTTQAPEMPPEAMEYLDRLEQFFNEAAGFTAILSGQGEPGVRAGVHAGVLLRTSSPRLRDRALLIEHQCSDFAQLALDIAQAKDAQVLRTRGGEEFTLSQLPPETAATVDSHSSSPAFAEDIRQLAFAYLKAGVIDGETLFEMTHPPREDLLIERYRAMIQAQAQAEAAAPPEEKSKKRG